MCVRVPRYLRRFSPTWRRWRSSCRSGSGSTASLHRRTPVVRCETSPCSTSRSRGPRRGARSPTCIRQSCRNRTWTRRGSRWGIWTTRRTLEPIRFLAKLGIFVDGKPTLRRPQFQFLQLLHVEEAVVAASRAVRLDGWHQHFQQVVDGDVAQRESVYRATKEDTKQSPAPHYNIVRPNDHSLYRTN